MKKHLKAALFSVVSIASIQSFTGSAFASCDPGEYIIRMSHSNRVFDHPMGDAAQVLADRIDQEFEGVACMEVFGNSILYTDKRSIEALLEEDIHIALPNFQQVEDYTNVLQVFSLPFVFKNIPALDEFLKTETGKSLLLSMRGHGIKGLGFWYNGMLQMSADSKLSGADAFKGKVFRSAGSVLSVDQFTSLGAESKDLEFTELYGAIQEGRVNGAEETFSNILARDIHKVQEQIVETNHSVGGGILITSQKWFDRLHPDFQARFLSIIETLTIEQHNAAADKDAKARRQILADGGNIREPLDEEREAWISACVTVWDKYSAGVNPVFARFIQQINERH